MPEQEPLSLLTIGGGVAEEFFDAELERVLENVHDPNAVADGKREIKLTFSFEPNKDNRREMAVLVKAESKLVGRRPHGSQAFSGRKNGKLTAVAYNPRQESLFDQVQDEKQEAESVGAKETR